MQSNAAIREISNPLVGRLVTHSDGFWHLFTEQNTLLAIPDDQVLAVRTVGSADITPVEEAASTEESTPAEDTKPGIGKGG